MCDDLYKHGMVPHQLLHTFGTGAYKIFISTVINIFGVKSKNNVEKNELNKLEWAIPCPMVRSGNNSKTKFDELEKWADLSILIIAMKTENYS